MGLKKSFIYQVMGQITGELQHYCVNRKKYASRVTSLTPIIHLHSFTYKKLSLGVASCLLLHVMLCEFVSDIVRTLTQAVFSPQISKSAVGDMSHSEI